MQWNPEQQRAIETTGTDLCVDAAAGSGKTTVLIERLVKLLGLHQVPLESIVAITFTDAAAAEMRERLRRKCREMESNEDREVMTRWRDLARRVDTARISTIHAFCAALLREQALGLELDPDFTLMTEAEAMLMREETVRNAIHALLLANDADARFVVERLGMAALERHMAGLLADRLAGDVVQDAQTANESDTLLALWREKVHAAWIDLMRLASRQHAVQMFRRQLADFDGLCENPDDGREQLRQEMAHALNDLNTAASEEDYAHVIDTLSKGMNGRRGASKNWPSDAMKQLSKLQVDVQNWAKKHAFPRMEPSLEREAAALTCAAVAVYQKVAQAYQAAKRERSALDFDDLIVMVRDVLRHREEVRNRVAQGIRHLLVDEFQDTDSIQYEIITLLEGANPDLEVFIVGDAKQSIYGFRGAEVDVFRQAHTDREVIALDRNYRTRPSLLAFVNEFFARTDLLAAVESDYHPMRPQRPESVDPAVEFLLPEMDEDHPGVEAQRLQQGALIASRIAAFCNPADPLQVDDTPRPARFGDVAILLRAFSNVHLYERGLRERGIPYQVVAGRGFYKQQEIIDLANLLRVVMDPWDELSLLGYLRGPLAGLSDETLVQLTERGSLLGVFHDAEQIDSLELDAARALIADLKARATLPLGAFMRYVLDRTAIEAILLPQSRGVQRAANVRKLMDLADDFARTRPPRLTDFVQYVGMVSDGDIREGEAALDVKDADAVTIMTIHNSKGLEFPIVILGDLGAKTQGDRYSPPILVDRELGPAAKVENEKGELQESPMATMIKRTEAAREEAERARLLYVAMTRARDRLLLGMGAKADRSSWQALFEGEWPLTSAEHWAVIPGSGWQGRVFRRIHADKVSFQQPDEPPHRFDEAGCLEQIAPIALSTSPSNRFAAGSLAAVMAETSRPDGDGGEEASLQDVDAMMRGSALHRLLEEWNLDEDLDPLIEGVLREECGSLGAADILRPYLRARAAAFRDSHIGQRMAAEHGGIREQPFMLRLDDALVTGIVDVAFADGSVLDYKTGQYAPWKHERYAWQVRIYALAYLMVHGRTAPYGYVYYLDSDDCHEVDVSDPILDETQRRITQAIAQLRSNPALQEEAENDGDVA